MLNRQTEQVSRQAYENNIGRSISRDITGRIPRMLRDDALSFFRAFEKYLTLNNVDELMWCKLLPAQLNANATKVYSQLTIEQPRDYSVIKREILSSMRLTSRTYI